MSVHSGRTGKGAGKLHRKDKREAAFLRACGIWADGTGMIMVRETLKHVANPGYFLKKGDPRREQYMNA